MKVVGVLQGVSAYREIAEEYVPERQPPLQDIVQAIRAAYQFQNFPLFPPNIPPAMMAILNFRNGRFADNDVTFGISQLVMSPKGDSVASTNTDQADLALEHLLDLMDAKFGYRLRQSSKTKIYWSHVVFEFDRGAEECARKIMSVEQIVTERVAKSKPFRFKGVLFGSSTSQVPPNSDPIDILDAQDFVIERRADVPFEQNRYFSSAPLSTAAHLEALREIEDALGD